MRLEITGHVDEFNMQETVGEALGLWMVKIAADNPDMEEMFDKVVDVDITELTAVIRFKLEGNDEWQVITTDNHAEIPELLTVKVETDEQGNLLTDTVTDNDGNSDYTDIEALIAVGNVGERKPVATMYEDGELELQSEYSFGDIEVDVFIDQECQVVVQALEFNFQYDGRLIAEAVFPADQLDNIKQHYLELAEAMPE